MKKILKLICTLTLALTVIVSSPINKDIEVSANSNYSLNCGTQYEVATVNSSGGFDKVGCHSNFSDARKQMWNYGDDGVIRHHSSLSPTKIIAMNNGVAISYPKRSGSTTLTITASEGNSNGYKTTYVTQHREMSDAETLSYDGSGNGTVSVLLNGFEGTTQLKNVDLVPIRFLEEGIEITLGGNDISSTNEQPFSLIVKQSHYKVEQNGNYKELVYYAYSGYNTTQYKMAVGPAADWMSVGSKYYSWDNFNFYSDREFEDHVGTYYNYYQFLPARSQSDITADQFDDYLNSLGYYSKPDSDDFNSLKSSESKLYGEGQTFIDAQNTYGINALLIYAMACLESGYGRSRYAVERNNLFGWNAFDSNPDSASYFSNISQAITEHMGINIRGYSDITDYRFFGSHVGNKGSGFNVKYAADPYWGAKIASIAYSIDKYANGHSGDLTDYNNYSLGLITEFDASVKSQASSSSSTLYTTTYGNNYQENFIVVMNTRDDNWTQVQSTNGVNSSGSIDTHKTNGNTNGLTAYNFERSVGYLPSSQVQPISSKPVTLPDGTVAEGDFEQDISVFSMDNGLITIFGTAYQPGIYVPNLSDLTHSLILSDGENITEIPLNQMQHYESNYLAAGFGGTSINVKDLKIAEYELSIKTVHEDYTETIALTNVSSITNEINFYNYEIVSDENKTILKVTRDEIEKEYVTGLNEISLDESGNLSVYGTAYVTGLENSKDTIKHQLEIISLKDNSVIDTVDLTSTTGDYDISDAYLHGLDYSYGWFEGSIPVHNLDFGEYKIELITTVQGEVYRRLLSGRDNLEDTSVVNLDDKYIQVLKQNSFMNRFEIHIKKYVLTIPDKEQLPTYMDGYNYMRLERFDELTNTLTIKGSGYIRRGSFSVDDNVQYTLFMINDETGEVKTVESDGLFELTDGDSSWNNTDEQTSSTKYNYDYTWYEFEIPLYEMKDGTYTFKILIETDDYAELVNLQDTTNRTYTNFSNDTIEVIGRKDTNNKYQVTFDLAGFETLIAPITD